MARLVCTFGVEAGLQQEIDKPGYLLGRANDCDIRVVDGAVSRYHCRIINARGRFMIEDLDSKNGIHFKSERIRGRRRPVEIGDLFRIGNCVYVLAA